MAGRYGVRRTPRAVSLGHAGADVDLRAPHQHPPRRRPPAPCRPRGRRAAASSTWRRSAASRRSTTGLEQLQRDVRRPRASACVGFPCNQFGGQEPGTSEEIETFCSTTYGVSFPMTEKVDVNGAAATPSTPSSPRSPTPRATAATSAGTSRSSCSPPTAPSRGSARWSRRRIRHSSPPSSPLSTMIAGPRPAPAGGTSSARP